MRKTQKETQNTKKTQKGYISTFLIYVTICLTEPPQRREGETSPVHHEDEGVGASAAGAAPSVAARTWGNTFAWRSARK